MTDEEYRQHPAISRSELWMLRDSPEKFRYMKENPQPTTDALLFGQVFHKYVLEPDTFNDEFIFEPECDRRTSEGKAIYKDFLSQVGNKKIVPRDMMKQAAEMGEAINNNKLAAKLIKGEHEQPYFWTDKDTGIECKCRTDVLYKGKKSLVIVDLKTTTDASTESFMKEAVKYGYHFQDAMYSTGVAENLGTVPQFVFIAIEKKPPYAINILQADKTFFDVGKTIFRELLDKYNDCKQTDKWYGYNGTENKINTLTLPAWALD